MTVQRVTSLAAPPVVGQRYLVPTVEYIWQGYMPQPWPVFLPKHEDAEILKFPWDHYHVDPRFLDRRRWERACADGAWGSGWGEDSDGYAQCQRAPLMRLEGVSGEIEPHGPVVWRRLRCARSEIRYVHGHQKTIGALRGHFAGRTCKHARTGWVCPHKHFPLGSIAPDDDGVITCPLHGLRVRAADGVVLP